MAKLGAAKFRKGQWVVWTDPDEDDIIKSHVGKVEAWTTHEDNRVYMIEEKDETAPKGVRLVFALEEELSPLRHD